MKRKHPFMCAHKALVCERTKRLMIFQLVKKKQKDWWRVIKWVRFCIALRLNTQKKIIKKGKIENLVGERKIRDCIPKTTFSGSVLWWEEDEEENVRMDLFLEAKSPLELNNNQVFPLILFSFSWRNSLKAWKWARMKF